MTDRVSIGNVEALAFIDMVPPPYAPTEFFPHVPLEAWEPYKSDHLENGQLQLYYGCFALRSQGRVVLVDTGMGPGPHPTRGNRRGDLLNRLKLQSVNPEDVSIVVHTHLHHDHVGWRPMRKERLERPFPMPDTWSPGPTGSISLSPQCLRRPHT